MKKDIPDRIRLTRIMVVRGKKKAPPLVRMVISPGSLPRDKET
jgi:hypothetical protein